MELREILAQEKKGKNTEQKKVLDYFLKKGCLVKNMSDEEYMNLVRIKRDSFNFKSKALSKIGLDEEEVNEIPPVMFQGFLFENAWPKRKADGNWVSTAYQVSWVFFSSSQVYLYSYTFNMDSDNKEERTDEFFYKDVTSFSTVSVSEQARIVGDQRVKIDSNKFVMVVPGDKLYLSMDGSSDTESVIQAMKQKLREKKM